MDRAKVKGDTIKGSQLLRPLFEYSGRLRRLRRNALTSSCSRSSSATGCSSPTRRAARRSTAAICRRRPTRSTPKARARRGRTRCSRTPAEFGFGFRLAIDQQIEYAAVLLAKLEGQLGDELVAGLLNNPGETEEQIAEQRRLVAALKAKLATIDSEDAQEPHRVGRLPDPPQRLVVRRRRLGLRHRLRRPGSRVRLADATSTSWCWTPKSTRTRAARRRRRRRAGRWPSSPPAESPAERRTSA